MDIKLFAFNLAVMRATAEAPQEVYKDTPVYVSEDACETLCPGNTVPFAGICGVRFASNPETITHCIFCNNKFMELAEDIRHIVFEHEIGHKVYQHTSEHNMPSILELFGFKGKYLQQEMEADAYAAAIVGKDAVIRALKCVVKDYPLLSRLLVQYRFNALNKL